MASDEVILDLLRLGKQVGMGGRYCGRREILDLIEQRILRDGRVENANFRRHTAF